jgi:hypothetical protein
MEAKVNEKNVKLLCKGYFKSLKCNSCKKYQKSNDKILKTSEKNIKKITNKTIKLWQKYGKKCDKCMSSKNSKNCNPLQLKKYSDWYYYGKKFRI